jgi:hypothetical protein
MLAVTWERAYADFDHARDRTLEKVARLPSQHLSHSNKGGDSTNAPSSAMATLLAKLQDGEHLWFSTSNSATTTMQRRRVRLGETHDSLILDTWQRLSLHGIQPILVPRAAVVPPSPASAATTACARAIRMSTLFDAPKDDDDDVHDDVYLAADTAVLGRWQDALTYIHARLRVEKGRARQS